VIEQLETRYGTIFVPDTDDGQYWILKTMGAYAEDEHIEEICALLDERPTGIAIDCGANFGCWSLPLAKHATFVVAFEPQRIVADLLSKTIDANRADIRVLPFALGSKCGTILCPDIDIENTANFGGIAMGVPHSEQPNAPMYEVQVVTIDEIVAEKYHVSFIKADVEGGETEVFRGAKRTIARCKPIIFAEAGHPETDRFRLGRLIESYGYNVEMIKDNNFLGMPL
jgi:FkbM family methyltransferase